MIFVSQAAAAAIELHPRGNVGKHLKHFFDTSGVPIQISDGYVNLSRLHQAAIYCFFSQLRCLFTRFSFKIARNFPICNYTRTLNLTTFVLPVCSTHCNTHTHLRSTCSCFTLSLSPSFPLLIALTHCHSLFLFQSFFLSLSFYPLITLNFSLIPSVPFTASNPLPLSYCLSTFQSL